MTDTLTANGIVPSDEARAREVLAAQYNLINAKEQILSGKHDRTCVVGIWAALAAMLAFANDRTPPVDREALTDIAVMMSEFVDNWPEPKKLKTAIALIAKTMRTLLEPPKHRFWGAGEPDCPLDIKAGNGELHTLLCKVCGEDNPRDNRCLARVLTTPAPEGKPTVSAERFATIGENWDKTGRFKLPLAMGPRLSKAARERLDRLERESVSALAAIANFPMGSTFSYHDEEGDHDPAYVVLPGGAMMPVAANAEPLVDCARAVFMVRACNAALQSPTATTSRNTPDQVALPSVNAEGREPCPICERRRRKNPYGTAM